MPRLPVVSYRDVLKVLRRRGFVFLRQSGSHSQLWHEEFRLLVTVPHHAELAKGTLLSILKQARMTRDEFLRER